MKWLNSLHIWLLIFVVLLLLSAIPAPAKELGDKLIVHEWGTFTSLQDESGRAIGGINTNDEPVPDFVYRLAHNMLLSPTEAPPTFFQGAPSCHPDVTMRLETPVIYFYPPAGRELPPLDVTVQFRGGWLTEFYPAAHAKAPGIDAEKPEREFPVDPASGARGEWLKFGSLKPDAVGELAWKGLKLNAPTDKGGPPQTDSKVWLAPREVSDVATVTTANGDAEKYLFYRGVGNVEASLKVVRSADGSLRVDTLDKPMPKSWFVEILPDGTGAFAEPSPGYQAPGPWQPLPAPFSKHTAGAITDLKASMRQALVEAGLFEDEADAMLKTWEVSYFQAPGTRLFYIVPREVTDALLPLTISQPAEITRVMVGRIEILTPAQRELMALISKGPSVELWRMRGKTGASDGEFFKDPANVELFRKVMDGESPLSALDLDVPEIYANYLKLGRFRNALILEEQRARPSAELAKFISENQFSAYEVEAAK